MMNWSLPGATFLALRYVALSAAKCPTVFGRTLLLEGERRSEQSDTIAVKKNSRGE